MASPRLQSRPRLRRRRWPATTDNAGAARELNVEKLRFAWRGPGKTWIATSESLFELPDNQPDATANDDIPLRRILDVAVEPGGAFWLATASGLFRHAPALWMTPRAAENITSSVRAMAEDTEGNMWFVSSNSLQRLQGEASEQYALPPAIAEAARGASALFALKDGTLALGANEKLFRFEPRSPTFSEVQPTGSRQRLKALGQLKDGSLCIQSSSATRREGVSRLEIFDGQSFKPLPLEPPEEIGREDWSTFFSAQNGDLWLGGARGIAWLRERSWHMLTSTNKGGPEDVVAFAEFGDGRMVCATPDKVWVFDGKRLDVVARGVRPDQRRVPARATGHSGWRRAMGCIASRKARGSRTRPPRACRRPWCMKCARTAGDASGPHGARIELVPSGRRHCAAEDSSSTGPPRPN